MGPGRPQGPFWRSQWDKERLRASLLWDDSVILINLLKNCDVTTFDDAMWRAVVTVTRPIGGIAN
jgi:hypothetical protein